MSTSRLLARTNIDRQLGALQQLYDVIEKPQYSWLVDSVTAIGKADYTRRVMIAGVGKNSNIASKISETMASLGLPSFYLNVSHCGHGDFGFIGPNDLIIHISRSGTTREMVEAIKHVRLIRPQVQQVLIHCKPEKAVNEDVDYEICIGAVKEGDEHGLAPTTSTTALLCFLDCVAVQASHNIGFERLDFLKFHPDGALGAMLKQEQGGGRTVVESKPDAAIHVERIELTEAQRKALTVSEPGQEFK